MQIRMVEKHGEPVAVVTGGGKLIADGQSALELAMNVAYETGCTRIALYQEALSEDFFVLRTGVAGEVLQKFTNYRIRCAIIGDFSGYTSGALHDFIYESNRGGAVSFVSAEAEAVERLTRA